MGVFWWNTGSAIILIMNRTSPSFHQGSGSSQLWGRLTPLLSTIRSNNINCCYQLQQNTTLSIDSNMKIFDSGVPAFPSHKDKALSLTSCGVATTQKDYFPTRATKTNNNSKNNSNSSSNNKNNSHNYRHRHKKSPTQITISPSKIKRHLVQPVPFEDIEKVMYKKPITPNMFEKFCYQLQIRNIQKYKLSDRVNSNNSHTHRDSHAHRRSNKKNIGSASAINSEFHTFLFDGGNMGTETTWKSKSKKKFWFRDSVTIKGNSSHTIDCSGGYMGNPEDGVGVEGKSIRLGKAKRVRPKQSKDMALYESRCGE